MNTDFRTRLFDPLNRAIRAALSTDPDTADSFASLSGKVFRIDITLPPMTLFLVPDPDGFSLAAESDIPPSVTITGSLPAFARLAGADNGMLSEGQVTMQGDAEAGQVLQRLLARFDFDWEELIARQLGDLPARKLGNLMRDAADWTRESAELGQENIVDYLTEERQLLASGVAMARLEQEVSALRSDTDRLSARVDRLFRKLDQGRSEAS